MRKLVVTEFITLDGVFEDPGGSDNFERGGWASAIAVRLRGQLSVTNKD